MYGRQRWRCRWLRCQKHRQSLAKLLFCFCVLVFLVQRLTIDVSMGIQMCKSTREWESAIKCVLSAHVTTGSCRSMSTMRTCRRVTSQTRSSAVHKSSVTSLLPAIMICSLPTLSLSFCRFPSPALVVVCVRVCLCECWRCRCRCSAPVADAAAAAVFSLLLAASRVAREKFAECECEIRLLLLSRRN